MEVRCIVDQESECEAAPGTPGGFYILPNHASKKYELIARDNETAAGPAPVLCSERCSVCEMHTWIDYFRVVPAQDGLRQSNSKPNYHLPLQSCEGPRQF